MVCSRRIPICSPRIPVFRIAPSGCLNPFPYCGQSHTTSKWSTKPNTKRHCLKPRHEGSWLIIQYCCWVRKMVLRTHRQANPPLVVEVNRGLGKQSELTHRDRVSGDAEWIAVKSSQ